MNQIIKKILQFLPLLAFVVFFSPMSYKLFGTIWWDILVLIVFIRPLSDIFPQVKLFKKLLMFRKQLWVISGTFILAHSVGFFLKSNLSIAASLVSASYWDFGTLFGWGLLGTILMIPVLLTSNVYSMKLLWKYWKPIQKLTYLFFVFGAVHLAFVKPMNAPSLLLLILFWAILWIMAFAKVRIEATSSPVIAFVLVIFLLTCSLNLYKNGPSLPEGRPNQSQSQPAVSSDESTDTGSDADAATDADADGDGNTKNDESINTSSDTNESVITVADTPTTTLSSGSTDGGQVLAISSSCIGCGKCARVDAAHFQMSDTTRQAVVISQASLGTTSLSRAISGCHARAISLS